MALIIFGFTSSLLTALILGFVLLRNWLQKEADLLIWTKHQLGLREAEREAKSGEDPATWRRNRNMHMR